MTKQSKETILSELSKQSPQVLEMAYLFAINYVGYGENVTKDWLTAVQQSAALEKAYMKGCQDTVDRLLEKEFQNSPRWAGDCPPGYRPAIEIK